MIFAETALPGVYAIDLEPHEDERGSFARVFCAREFAEHGLDTRVAQSSIARNRVPGTLRGMHWQEAPHEEVKLVRCVRGEVYDVVADLRVGSPTFGRWIAVELSEANGRALHVPAGCAHGYQTLAPETAVWYQMSAPHVPEAARGFRFDDPAFAIEWPPAGERVISERDRSWPDFVLASRAGS